MTFLPRINDLVVVKDDPLAATAIVVNERAPGVVQCQFEDGSTITASYYELRAADVDEEYRP